MIDVDIGWGDQDRLGMCQRVEPIFTVVVSDPGVPNTPKGIVSTNRWMLT